MEICKWILTEWIIDNFGSDWYYTTCLDNIDADKKNYKFCPFCGKKIEKDKE